MYVHIKKRIFISLCLILCISTFITSCGTVTNDDLIADCIYGFIDSLNEGDIDSALECIDDKTGFVSRFAMSIGDQLLGNTGFGDIGVADILGLGAAFGTDGSMFEVYELQIDYTSEDTAVASCILSVDDPSGNGEASKQEVDFNMVYSDELWYIDFSDELGGLKDLFN